PAWPLQFAWRMCCTPGSPGDRRSVSRGSGHFLLPSFAGCREVFVRRFELSPTLPSSSEYRATTERASALYVRPETEVALPPGTMSLGDSRLVSIQRCQGFSLPFVAGNSNSSGSQYAFTIRWTSNFSFLSSADSAIVCDQLCQSGS